MNCVGVKTKMQFLVRWNRISAQSTNIHFSTSPLEHSSLKMRRTVRIEQRMDLQGLSFWKKSQAWLGQTQQLWVKVEERIPVAIKSRHLKSCETEHPQWLCSTRGFPAVLMIISYGSKVMELTLNFTVNHTSITVKTFNTKRYRVPVALCQNQKSALTFGPFECLWISFPHSYLT